MLRPSGPPPRLAITLIASLFVTLLVGLLCKNAKNRHFTIPTSNNRISSIWWPLRGAALEGQCGCPCRCSNSSLASLARFVIVPSDFARRSKIDTSFFKHQTTVSCLCGGPYGVLCWKAYVVAPAGVRTARSLACSFRHRSERFCTALKNRHIILQTLNDRISSM